MIILKLGGSIITKKDSEEPLINYNNLNRIAEEIASSSFHEMIIVHGAGSYGHPFAEKYKIGKKIRNEQDFNRKKIGFCLTQSWVKKLNTIVCDILRENGVLAVSIQPSSFILTKNKRIYSCNLDLIKKYLDLGFVPVIYGDVVPDLDESIKICVLSGDQIINYLGENLKPHRVVLGSDVDGIYTKDPKKYEDAELLKTVTSLEDLKVEGSSNVDVTGGMKGKLSELIHLSDLGIESEIINAGKKDLIKRALNNQKVIGTVIKKKVL